MNLHHLSLYFSGLGGVEFILCGTNNWSLIIMGTIILDFCIFFSGKGRDLPKGTQMDQDLL